MNAWKQKSTLSIVFLLVALAGQAQTFVDLEGGGITGTPYNRVRIPNQGGTTFDLAQGFKPDVTLFYRIRPGITVGRRHTFTALFAPLTVQYKGAFAENVSFNGVLFRAGQPITARYTFNSYRLTYRYLLVDAPKLSLGVGLTAKIRDANVAVQSEDGVTNFANVGFVPLLNMRLQYAPSEQWSLLLEGDALGASQGRAEDFFLGATYKIAPNLRLKGGYRVVEGGADTDEVYNFTWINYASVGVVFGQWK